MQNKYLNDRIKDLEADLKAGDSKLSDEAIQNQIKYYKQEIENNQKVFETRKLIVTQMITDYMSTVQDSNPYTMTCSKKHFEEVIMKLDITDDTNTLINLVLDSLDDVITIVSYTEIGKRVDSTFTQYCEQIGLI